MRRRAVGITSGGSLVGENVLDCLEGRRAGLRVVATSSIATVPALARYDGVAHVPETRSGAPFAEAVAGWIEREALALVLPSRDEDVVALAELAARHPGLAPRLLTGTPDAARALTDKWASAVFARECGLPFAETWLGGSPEPGRPDPALPCIAKPRCGFASMGVTRVETAAQRERALATEGLVVQEWLGPLLPAPDPEALGIPLFHSLEADKLSVQTCVGPAGEVAPPLATRHRMRMGRSVAVERETAPELAATAEAFAGELAAMGWRGPLNLQCQRRAADGRFRVYELNGRFTGATSARLLLGFDEVGEVLRAFADISLGPSSSAPVERVRRRPVSVAVPAGCEEA